MYKAAVQGRALRLQEAPSIQNTKATCEERQIARKMF